MPRVKKIDYEEELFRIEAMIKKHEKVVSDLKKEKEMLVKKKQEIEMVALYNFIIQSGKTIDEFMEQSKTA